MFGREIAHPAPLLAAVMMAVVSAWTALTQPDIAARWFAWPNIVPLSVMPIASVGVTILIWRSLWGKHEARTLQLSMVLFLLGFGGLAVSLFPYVVSRHYTVWTGAADHATLRFVGVGVIVIVPIILAYLGHAYWVFRGKTVEAHAEVHPTPASVVGRTGYDSLQIPNLT